MKRVLLFVSVFLALIVSPLTRAEGTQPLTDAYIASIKAGCTSALQGLLQVERSEAVTRVNRGREYESLLRLTAAFNSRVVLNKLDAAPLISTTAKMQTKFSDFQDHYISYADRVDLALDVNCKTAPVTFYDNLTAVREARALVAGDVKDMDVLLADYQKSLDLLKVQLTKIEAAP